MLITYRFVVPKKVHVEDEKVGAATEENAPRLTRIVGHHLNAEVDDGLCDVNPELLLAHIL